VVFLADVDSCGNVFLWYYKEMNRCLRVDIFDSENIIIRVKNVRLYISRDNAAKNAFGHERPPQ
jgi:hypothetical protein